MSLGPKRTSRPTTSVSLTSLDPLEQVRQRFMGGELEVLDDPLLPALLLGEVGADWFRSGFHAYTHLLFARYSGGTWDREGKHLSKEQREDLLGPWARELMGPPSNFARWQAVEVTLAHARRTHLLGLDNLLAAIHRAGLPTVPETFKLLRRLIALHPSRSTLDLRPLVRLEELCGMSANDGRVG